MTPHHFNKIKGSKNRIYTITSIHQNGGGFTLIELLIYIAIVGLILVLMVGFFWDIILVNIKEDSYQEVQQNGRFALDRIEKEIKKASGINSPVMGNSAYSLSLVMANPSLNPTIFDLNNGQLRITQGNSSPVELTTDQVIVTNLQFTNLSYQNTPGTIRIEMTIENLNPENRPEYEASINLESSFSLLQGGASP